MMKPTRLAFYSLILSSFGLVAHAFDKPAWCANRLNPQEAVICATAQLSQLDLEMSRVFDAARSNGHPEVRYQVDWLSWRATCALDRPCLQRRYESRIKELKPKELVAILTVPAPQFGTSQLVETRFQNGRLEKVYSDGRITWESQGGKGTIFPDGTQNMAMFQNVGDASPPPFPPLYSAWALNHELSLENMLLDQLGPDGLAQYKATYATGDFFQRVFEHLKAIEFFLKKEGS